MSMSVCGGRGDGDEGIQALRCFFSGGTSRDQLLEFCKRFRPMECGCCGEVLAYLDKITMIPYCLKECNPPPNDQKKTVAEVLGLGCGGTKFEVDNVDGSLPATPPQPVQPQMTPETEKLDWEPEEPKRNSPSPPHFVILNGEGMVTYRSNEKGSNPPIRLLNPKPVKPAVGAGVGRGNKAEEPRPSQRQPQTIPQKLKNREPEESKSMSPPPRVRTVAGEPVDGQGQKPMLRNDGKKVEAEGPQPRLPQSKVIPQPQQQHKITTEGITKHPSPSPSPPPRPRIMPGPDGQKRFLWKDCRYSPKLKDGNVVKVLFNSGMKKLHIVAEEEYDKLQQYQNKLNSFVMISGEGGFPRTPVVGEIVLAGYGHGQEGYYRARVVKVNEEKQRCQVTYVDFGDGGTVKWDKMLELTEKLAMEDIYGVSVVLHGVPESKFDPEADFQLYYNHLCNSKFLLRTNDNRTFKIGEDPEKVFLWIDSKNCLNDIAFKFIVEREGIASRQLERPSAS